MYYILKDKKPVKVDNVLEWANHFESANNSVQSTHINDVHISTVFLGTGHSFGRGGPPILFETMIFGGVHNEYQERYATWEEAEKGHMAAVKLVKSSK